MKTVIIVQARMTSTRLPGKVMKTVLGKTLLDYHIERLKRCNEADALVLATPSASVNQPLWDAAPRLGLPLFKGDEEDVLGRYHGAAREAGADIIVRVTSDCPLIDPAVVDHMIQRFKASPASFDYVSNTLRRTYPRGMDAEVFSFKALDEAFKDAQKPSEREHVTAFLYGNPSRYRLKNVSYPTDESRYRWTVDTQDDLELIRRLIENVFPKNPNFTLEDLLSVMRKHPEWESLNAHVAQKI